MQCFQSAVNAAVHVVCQVCTAILCASIQQQGLRIQVLGRNLEALVTRAQDIKADWKDEFVSVEHMLLAFLDDAKFGTNLLKGANLDRAKLEAAVKEVRGSNRVTDQVSCGPCICSIHVSLHRMMLHCSAVMQPWYLSSSSSQGARAHCARMLCAGVMHPDRRVVTGSMHAF